MDRICRVGNRKSESGFSFAVVRLEASICTHICNRSSIERKRLIEGRCAFEHATHLMNWVENRKSESGFTLLKSDPKQSYNLTFVTLEVLKDSGWLKAAAPVNMESMFVADPKHCSYSTQWVEDESTACSLLYIPVSQLMVSLNVLAPGSATYESTKNKLLKSVILDTSQSPIWIIKWDVRDAIKVLD